MNDPHSSSRSRAALPPIAKRQLGWFNAYVSWFLRRNFHGLHLLRLTNLEQLESLPLLVCLNHPSWWDPLVGLHLSQRFFPLRHHVAPIAAAGLAKYKFFERLGFFWHQRGYTARRRPLSSNRQIGAESSRWRVLGNTPSRIR